VFTIRQEDGGRTSVSVQSGTVNVRGAAGEEKLVAGASEVFPRPGSKPEPEPAAPSSVNPAPPRPASWQRLARAGDYARAFAVIESAGPVRDDADDLLLAADSARLTGHPSRAVPFLRRFIDRFPADSRASLATFTLGRVLLDDLGQPRDAARAFAAAYADGGPLAEDALAREVEAWNRAGDVGAAKSAAARYLAAYPAGRRAGFARRVAQGL
jgi:transmembrane sensor